jgi:hypothetical protein
VDKNNPKNFSRRDYLFAIQNKNWNRPVGRFPVQRETKSGEDRERKARRQTGRRTRVHQKSCRKKTKYSFRKLVSSKINALQIYSAFGSVFLFISKMVQSYFESNSL